ncbi:MAG: serine/threonine-protein kinase [Kiritimatiellia bacterium]|nr:serine/threonine-protein kinase [Kiritimatiellia bacterium]
MACCNTGDLERFLAGHGPILSVATFPVGTVFGRWRITAFLGKGGNGEVYRAESSQPDHPVALKVHIPVAGRSASQTTTARQRFEREAHILSKNTYPFFPRFYGAGEAHGHLYFAIELLDPVTLPSTDSEVAEFLFKTCTAVGALHRNGLVHRDIKPQNIMRRANGDLVLIDLGLVKQVAPDAHHDGTSVTLVDGKAVGVGTPHYAAPEQFVGGAISPASDIHALGIIANECFGGKPTSEWERIISRATSSIPQCRYHSIEELARAVRERHSRKGSRRGVLAALGLTIAGILAALILRRTAGASRVPFVPNSSTRKGAGNPIGTALGDPLRHWESGGIPSQPGEDVTWRVSKYGNALGRESCVASGGGGRGKSTSYLRTQIAGPCKVTFDYLISTYMGDAIVSCDETELMHFNDIANPGALWQSASYDIPEGKHQLEFVYKHSGQGFVNKFNGFAIANFKVAPR